MRTCLTTAIAVLSFAFLTSAAPASAQQSTGNIAGRVVDEQEAGIVGAMVTARNVDTGFVREVKTDTSGLYVLNALPAGWYDVSSSAPGLARFEGTAMMVNVARTTDLEIVLRVAQLAETVTVTAEAPVISVTSSTISQVVETTLVESLPLNGRQFANLAATVPGVGLGFHSDLTKSTQYSPQISGGNGRNVNYVVDGGDNNDDTVGGALQLFPLEAIQEFNVMTQRFDAEHGRGGAVLNVVTKSGTNDMHGSWFTLFRDNGLNAQTFTERINNIEKQNYARQQFGGSLGGPIVADKAHYFGAYERTQQDTKQVVSTLGLFPAEDGVYDVLVQGNDVHRQADHRPHSSALPGGALCARHQFAADRRGAAGRTIVMGNQRKHLRFGEHQSQLGCWTVIERVRLSVFEFRQRHSGDEHGAPSAVSKRSDGGHEPGGSAEHRTDEMAVSRRRLLVDERVRARPSVPRRGELDS